MTDLHSQNDNLDEQAKNALTTDVLTTESTAANDANNPYQIGASAYTPAPTPKGTGKIRKAGVRILLGTILPPAIATVAVSVYLSFLERGENILGFLGIGLIFAYLFMGLQSLIYSLLMEKVVWPKFGTGLLGHVVSTVLGTLCGATLFAFGSLGVEFLLLGAGAGAVVGKVLSRHRHKSQL